MTTWILACLAFALIFGVLRRLINKKGLVGNWRKSLRYYSNWCFATIASIQTSVLVFVSQSQLQAKLLFDPTWTWGELVQAVIAGLAVLGFILRNISQEEKDIPDHSGHADAGSNSGVWVAKN